MSYCRRRDRSAASTVLMTAAVCSGRPSSVTLPSVPSRWMVRRRMSTSSDPPKSRIGTSDQGGCSWIAWAKSGRSGVSSASSVRRIAPAPASSSRASAAKLSQRVLASEARASSRDVSAPSLPRGAKTSTRSGRVITPSDPRRGQRVPGERRHAGEHTLEMRERRADAQPLGTDLQLTDGALVGAGALLHHRDGAVHRAVRLEEPQQHHRVGDVADVHGHGHRRAENSLLRDAPAPSPRASRSDRSSARRAAAPGSSTRALPRGTR